MLLQDEPSPTPYDIRFQLFGVPVRVSPLFWVIALLMGSNAGDARNVVIFVIVAFYSILIHEFGHALAFRFYRQPCHIVLHGAGGLAIPGEDVFGFGFSVTHNRRDSTPLSRIIIALAGPMAGFLLAAVVIVALIVSNRSVELYVFDTVFPIGNPQNPLASPASVVVKFTLYVNIFWGLFNLLPVLPLDGGKVCRELCVMASPWQGDRAAFTISAITGLAAGGYFLVNHQLYAGLMFIVLAITNYMSLQQMGGGRRGWH